MPELKLVPLAYADRKQLSLLMDEEQQAWISTLAWDYAPIRQILCSFLDQNMLPGYAAVNGDRLLGYTYFLINRDKGIVGTVYARPERAQQVAEEILGQAIVALRGSPGMRRIEAQVIPFHELNFTGVFTHHGFQYYPRYYLELDLVEHEWRQPEPNDPRVVPWDSGLLRVASGILLASYRGETDAVLYEDYSSEDGCETYLRSLIENPGCGIFLPNGSFIAFDDRGFPCGFLIASRISSQTAMIPQISVDPGHQGSGIGRQLIHRALAELRRLGFRAVSLAVTKKNRRAFEWYQRLGFRVRKEFGAYVWERN